MKAKKKVIKELVMRGEGIKKENRKENKKQESLNRGTMEIPLTASY